MDGTRSDSEVLSSLAHDFTERMRRGERPSIHEYAEAHRPLAAKIQELFPTLLLLEQIQEGGVPTHRDISSTLGAEIEMPDRLGDYRLVRLIGAGGMGRVFEAIQESLGRRVALKVLPKRLSDNRLSERFAREAQVVAKLHHSNIVPVFDFGNDRDYTFYAMQLIEGRSLDRYLRAATPTTLDSKQTSTIDKHSRSSDTLSIVCLDNVADAGWDSIRGTSPESYCRHAAFAIAQVADGLAHAHSAGIIHRDIKPSNLLLDQHGSVWITDFGLADSQDASELTLRHEIVGTLRYLAPERFHGPCDVRSDIYSLGVTLYELLTRQPAFGDLDRAKVMQNILTHSVRPLRIANPFVPKDLETVVHKAMACDPSDRYQTAREMADDLLRFCHDQPVLARRQKLWERAWRWSRHNRRLAGMGLFAIMALIAFALVSSFAYHREKQIRDELQVALEDVQTAEAQGRKDLYRSYVEAAKAAQLSRQKGQRFNSLDALRKAGQLLPKLAIPENERPRYREDLRVLAASSLTLPDIRDVGDLPNQVAVDNVYLDRYAMRDASGAMVIYQWPGDKVVARISDVSEQTVFGFTSDRNVFMLFDQESNTLYGRKVDTSVPTRVAQSGEPGGRLTHWELARHGPQLMLIHQLRGHRLIEVLDWPAGKFRFRRSLPYDDSSYIIAGRLSPDGRYLATIEGSYGTENSHRVRVTELDSGRELTTLQHDESVDSVAWQTDSETLAAGLTDSNDIVMWNVREQKQLRVLTDQRGGGPKLSSNSTGELFCSFSSWSNRVDLWHPYSGNWLLSLSETTQFAWSADDGRLLGCSRLANGQWHYSVAEPSPVLQTLARNQESGASKSCREVSVHRAGRLLAAGTDNNVSLFDLQTGQDVGSVPVGYALYPWFIPETGDLLTYSDQGLLRWPVQIDDQNQLNLTIGPPTKLSLPFPPTIGTQVMSDNSGNVIAVSAHQRAAIVHDFGKRVITLGPLVDCRRIAVSPNGRWVITASHVEGPLDVWDAMTGAHVRRLSDRTAELNVRFSPDNQSVAFQSFGARLLETESWREIDLADAPHTALACYSPDNKLAIDLRGGVNLREVRTGRKLCALTLPDPPTIWHATFTPDGTRAILSCNERQLCYVWHLARLGRELSALGLGWDSQHLVLDQVPRSPELRLPLAVQIVTTK